jgi:hypothetical protein
MSQESEAERRERRRRFVSIAGMCFGAALVSVIYLLRSRPR